MTGRYGDLLAEAARRKDAETRAQAAETKLARIKALHVLDIGDSSAGDRPRCSADLFVWPCPTAKILDATS